MNTNGSKLHENGDFESDPNQKNEFLSDSLLETTIRQRWTIILTTLTTVVGLLPTVYGIGGDAKMMVPTVMAMAYGLLFATVLTLYFIPALYLINEDINKKLEAFIVVIKNNFSELKSRITGLLVVNKK